MLGLVIFFVIVSSLVIIGRLDHSATIGAQQLELLKRYQDFEGTRVYVENAVKLSAYKALQDMDASSCAGINAQEFDDKLALGVREYLKADLSQPAFKVKLPRDYEIHSSVTSDSINIVGIGDDIEISSPISETLGKLSKFIKAGQEYEPLPNSEYNLLILRGPKYLISGGANININLRCEEYRKYVEALDYRPGSEVSA